MKPRLKQLLLSLARQMVREADLWERVYGKNRVCKDPDDKSWLALRNEYHDVYEETIIVKEEAIPELIELGHTVYTIMISGDCGEGRTNYDVEDIIIEEFGDKVVGDSEGACIWIMTTPDYDYKVLSRIEELIGDDGHVTSEYTESPHIAGLGNWTLARKLIAYFEGKETL